MAEVTLFVALPFDFNNDGGIAAGEPIDCPSLPPRYSVRKGFGRYLAILVL
jgi:hypothetical protein